MEGKWHCCSLALALVARLCGAALAADTLAEVKKKGVLVAGVKDSAPPFGYIDEKTRTIIGYDIDFVNAIAKKLGVKVELKPVTSATRMPQLHGRQHRHHRRDHDQEPRSGPSRSTSATPTSSPARSSSPRRGPSRP